MDRWEVYKIDQNKKLIEIKNPQKYIKSCAYKIEQKEAQPDIQTKKK